MANGDPLIFYIHPREIDVDHPRIPMSAGRRFKSYVNLRQTEMKIRRILREFPVTTCNEFLFGTELKVDRREAVSVAAGSLFRQVVRKAS